MEQPPNQKEPPPSSPTQSRRPRAPTITIDTAVTPSSGPEMSFQPSNQQQQQPARVSTSSNPPSPQDDTVSPTTTVDPLSSSWTSSSKTASQQQQPTVRPELRAATSFDSAKDSRPTSPHNVSSPVLGRSKDVGAATFLSVPSNLRSRQNSVDSDDAATRSNVSSTGGETAVAGSSQGETPSSMTRKRPSSEHSNEKMMTDESALKPDVGHEADFEVENNPFAYSPGQLNKMFNPKSLAAFYQLGGLRGLEKGLQSDRKSGLSVDEVHPQTTVSFQEAMQAASPQTLPPTKLESEGLVGDSKEKERRPSTSFSNHGAAQAGGNFVDRKRVYKDNRLPEKKGKTLLQLMWITYNDKVLMLLTAAAIVSLAIGLYQTFDPQRDPAEPQVEWIEGVAIIAAIVIVVVVGSLNDYQKERQFARLNKKKQDRLVKVTRSGKAQEISVFDILVGDVIHLEPGDMVPVDGVLIDGFDVKCDESQATGESDIIKKQAADKVYDAIQNQTSLKKLDPFIQSGARVMEGVGTFMCTSTGIHSTYGRTLIALNEDPEITPLQSKLNVIAEYIAKVGGAAGLLLFIVLFIKFLAHLPKSDDSPAEKGRNFLDIFIVVVTIIVVAVPEGLPLAVTLALAFATNRMLRDNNLVRHLKACEVMGNATTICSDKTGTLTQNKMRVVAGTIATTFRWGRDRPTTPTSDDESEMSAVDNGPEQTGAEIGKYLADEARQLMVQSVAVNSTAFESDERDGNNDAVFIGSKTETALLLYAKDDLGMGSLAIERSNATVLQLFPFDSGRKCMGAVVSLGKGRARLYVKGASEIVVAKCTQMWSDPKKDLSAIAMTREHHATVGKLIDFYASNSLRTIGMAYRDFEQWPPRLSRRTDDEIPFEDLFHNMVFTTMVGIQDPLRDGVPEAVRLCQRAGVVVRMVTGDNKLTAEAIARECGILQPNSIVMEGPEFRNMSKAQQELVIPRLHVLARSSPEDKRILVKRLKEKSEIVAVTGDGTNDAPALRMADVGFSMGIAGTEVAKEASSIILMDDNFNSIVKALKWGRAVNDAVKRFLQFQLTVNVTAVVLTFVSAVHSDEEASVLTAVQLLWVNLIMDTLAALALATDPPQDSILNRKPEPRNASIISTTMWKMILGQAVYQLTVTFILYFGGANVLPDPGEGYTLDKEMIATLVFNTFVWMQIFNQWNNRRLDNHFNILEGITRNWIFLAISFTMCAAQVVIIFVTRDAFKINPIPEGKVEPQGAVLWAVAIVLGIISIPVGMVIRLIPDQLLEKCIPQSWKRRAQGNVPGVTVSDEEAFDHYPAPLADVRDELAFLKRVKGGRINNLKFAMRHPRETLMKQRSRSPSHSRSSSLKMPQTPTREDSFGSTSFPPGGSGALGAAAGLPATPEGGSSRKRSKSMRSRSNSALGAPTVMAGIVAAGVAAGWSPIDRSASREDREGGEASNLNSVANMSTASTSTHNNGSQSQKPSRTPTE